MGFALRYWQPIWNRLNISISISTTNEMIIKSATIRWSTITISQVLYHGYLSTSSTDKLRYVITSENGYDA